MLEQLKELLEMQRVLDEKDWCKRVSDRLNSQGVHIKLEEEKGKDKFYQNEILDIDVKTKQEKDIVFPLVDIVKVDKNRLHIDCFYKNIWEV